MTSSIIRLLPKLKHFDIANNKFHGTIPQAAMWECVPDFSVNGNDLTGTIPLAVCSWSGHQKDTLATIVADISRKVTQPQHQQQLIVTVSHLCAQLTVALSAVIRSPVFVTLSEKIPIRTNRGRRECQQ